MQRNRIGEQLGNYRLTALLGRGGFAEVYLGEHVRLKTKTAIKVLLGHLSPEESEHFQREAQIIATLKHPHIVHVLDFDVDNGTPFLVMDYYPEGTLRQRHPKGTRVPLETIALYVRQVAGALQYAHDQQLIHRDVKPENMLIRQQGEITLSDFGIALVAHNTSSMIRQAPTGTIPYMAPEQIQAHARPASDQYALAIVAYEWSCGKRPFEGTFAEVIAKHLSAPPPALQQHEGVTPAIEQVIYTALAKDPRQRYPTIQEFATALTIAVQKARPIQSAAMPPVESVLPADSTVTHSSQALPASQIQPQETRQLATPPAGLRGAFSGPVRTTNSHTTVPGESHTNQPARQMPRVPVYLPPPSGSSTTPRPLTVPKSYLSIIAGLIILFLLAGLILFGVQANNQHRQPPQGTTQQVNVTSTAFIRNTTTAPSQQPTVNVKATATALVYATATMAVLEQVPHYFASSGKMFIYEALDIAGDHWDNSSDSTGSCQFSGGSYHVTAINPGLRHVCSDLNVVAGGHELVEVEMTILKGDCVALHIRYRTTSGNTYPFRVCQNGSAMLVDHSNSRDIILGQLGPGSVPLKAGWNTLGLEVSSTGSLIGYVNGQRVLSVQDDGPNRIGNVGLSAESINAATEVAYRNLRAWQ